MATYSTLLLDAETGRYPNDPPAYFAGAMGMAGASPDFLQAAWGLFRERGRPARVTHKEVQERLRGGAKLVLDDTGDQPVGCVRSHFLDSGSFSLWGKAKEYQKANGGGPYDYYDTPEHYQYLDNYAKFVKDQKDGIDYYANVDVIPEPKKTARNQSYLEQHGLDPVPVVHYQTDILWLRKYIDAGYKYIALGGLVGSMDKPECRQWLNKAFDEVCDTKDRMPRVKVHGFGVTAHEIMIRYPWYSVDNAAWAKVGGFGGVFMPHKRNGKFDLLQPPYILKFSDDAPERSIAGRHYHTLRVGEKKIVEEWLDDIGVPLGTYDRDRNVVKHGVTTRYIERWEANLRYFSRLAAALPPWPWAFRTIKRPTLGVF